LHGLMSFSEIHNTWASSWQLAFDVDQVAFPGTGRVRHGVAEKGGGLVTGGGAQWRLVTSMDGQEGRYLQPTMTHGRWHLGGGGRRR